MKLYITSGSIDFMESLQEKYKNEKMIAMHGKGNALLIHETEQKSLFATPIQYDIIEGNGALHEEGFFALNNVSVTDEGKPIFEHWILSHADKIPEQSGYIAYRLLRPLSGNTYVILTQWSGKIFFDRWKDSITYHKLLGTYEKGTGLEKKPHMFSSAPYVTTYKTITDD